MAKARSIQKISGDVGDLTFVNSKAYGYHVRAKRGTKTAITLADGMKTSINDQTQANLMAKVIFDSVNLFAPKFKDGKFWTRLISAFRQQKKAGLSYSYSDFKEFEMRLDYPLRKQGWFKLTAENNTVNVDFEFGKHFGYLISVLRVATDESLTLKLASETAEYIVKKDEKIGNTVFEFQGLPENVHVLYVLKVEQFERGKTRGILSECGVRFYGG